MYIIKAQRIIFQRAPWSKLLVKPPKEWSGFCTASVTTQYFEPKQQVQCPIKCWVSYSRPLSWNHSLLKKNGCSAGDNYSMRPLARCWCSPIHNKSSHNRKWTALYRFLNNFIFFVLNIFKKNPSSLIKHHTKKLEGKGDSGPYILNLIFFCTGDFEFSLR